MSTKSLPISSSSSSSSFHCGHPNTSRNRFFLFAPHSSRVLDPARALFLMAGSSSGTKPGSGHKTQDTHQDQEDNSSENETLTENRQNYARYYRTTRDEQILSDMRARYGSAFRESDERYFTGSYLHSLLSPLYPPLPKVSTPPLCIVTRKAAASERFMGLTEEKDSSSSQDSRTVTRTRHSKRKNRDKNRRAEAVVDHSTAKGQADTESENSEEEEKSTCAASPRNNAALKYASLPPSPVIVKRHRRTGKFSMKNADAFFVPHPHRKGYIICLECNDTQWPPNREKHILKCLNISEESVMRGRLVSGR